MGGNHRSYLEGGFFMSVSDTVGVCLRCAEVNLEVLPFVVCQGCGKPWQLMSMKDAMYFFRDALKSLSVERPSDALSEIAMNGGFMRVVEGSSIPWTGEYCASVAKKALEAKL